MDGELREAERAARARPEDPVARRALVLALERAGDRRAALAALDDGARAGDAEAAAELRARLFPPPLPLPRGTLRPRVARVAGGPQPARWPRLLGLAGETLVVAWRLPWWRGEGDPAYDPPWEETDAVAGLDPRTLAVRWRVPDRAAVSLVERDVVVWGPRRAPRLELLDGATGALIRGADLPPGDPGAWTWGRGLVGAHGLGAGGKITALDLAPTAGRFGARGASVEVGSPRPLGFVAGGLLLFDLDPDASGRLRHVVDGRLTSVDWSGEAAWGLADADGDEVLILAGPGVEYRARLQVPTAWRVRGRAASFLPDGLVATLDDDVVSLRPRQGGDVRESARVPPHRPGADARQLLAVASDAVLVARVSAGGVGFFAVGLDGALTGNAGATLADPVVDASAPLVVEDGVLVAVTTAAGRIDVVRFDRP